MTLETTLREYAACENNRTREGMFRRIVAEGILLSFRRCVPEIYLNARECFSNDADALIREVKSRMDGYTQQSAIDAITSYAIDSGWLAAYGL